jgi:hypothetical protein
MAGGTPKLQPADAHPVMDIILSFTNSRRLTIRLEPATIGERQENAVKPYSACPLVVGPAACNFLSRNLAVFFIGDTSAAFEPASGLPTGSVCGQVNYIVANSEFLRK